MKRMKKITNINEDQSGFWYKWERIWQYKLEISETGYSRKRKWNKNADNEENTMKPE